MAYLPPCTPILPQNVGFVKYVGIKPCENRFSGPPGRERQRHVSLLHQHRELELRVLPVSALARVQRLALPERSVVDRPIAQAATDHPVPGQPHLDAQPVEVVASAQQDLPLRGDRTQRLEVSSQHRRLIPQRLLVDAPLVLVHWNSLPITSATMPPTTPRKTNTPSVNQSNQSFARTVASRLLPKRFTPPPSCTASARPCRTRPGR